jgi:hypothetical protein
MPRALSHVRTDSLAVRALIQAACDVELWTIPLYMCAMYSIQGVYSSSAPTDPKQVYWPGLRPRPVSWTPGTAPSSEVASQLAFNVVFTVFIQEMLHLQLAGNLARAMGVCPRLAMPTYNGKTIPCVGDPGRLPDFQKIRIELGPLDENAIALFMAIERPEWKGSGRRPAVPFRHFDPGSATDPAQLVARLPTFGSIGHLYDCLRRYLQLKYNDGQTLWQKVYQPRSSGGQLDLFTGARHGRAYQGIPSTLDLSQSAEANWPQVLEMIDAIVAQGEGGKAHSNAVPAKDQPQPRDDDWAGGCLSPGWQKISHWARFRVIRRQLLAHVQTFPRWREAHEWTAADLHTTADDVRLAALNNPETGKEAGAALEQSLLNLLTALETAWAQDQPSFDLAAMQALYTRAQIMWAAGGRPDFGHLQPASVSKTDPHACQGLSSANPGNQCAAVANPKEVGAVIHTCGGSNSCSQQGGCGWPPNPPSVGPGTNSCTSKGGCGVPIPVAQVMHLAGSTTFKDKEGQEQTVSYKSGDSVSDLAWKIYALRNQLPAGAQPPTPTPLRMVLPPS